MRILRFELCGARNSCFNLYQNGNKLERHCAASVAELAKSLDKSNIDGIYVHRGPGGFSRLRAMHAYTQGLAEALNVPLASYTKWTCSMARSAPQKTRSLQPIYMDKEVLSEPAKENL